MSLTKYPQENVNILHCDIFWFLLKDEEFVSKTINDISIDFVQAKSGSLQRRWRLQRPQHITSNMLQVTPKQPKSTLMRHQHTDLPPSNNLSSQDYPVISGIQVNTSIKCHPTRRNLILNKPIQEKIDVPSVEIQNV